MINLDHNQTKIRKKRDTSESEYAALYEGRELTPNALKSGIFSIKEKQGKRTENINF